MPSEHSGVKFEIGHVLFIDIVGYSKLNIHEQSEQLEVLKQIVRGTEQCKKAEAESKLLRLPTGDGGALVFRTTPEAPVLCALEVSKELKKHPELHVRMGVHSGPVNEVTDLNEQSNVAGAGINIAQRVMDCGDTGHILVSKRVADDLEHYPQWRSLLHELGECEVKHGLRISLLNLYGDEAGNPELPEKFRQTKKQTARAAAGRGEELWVAVLPFKSSGDAEMESFANGLGEDITTGLSRFRYLSVVASASAAQLKGEIGDERTLAAKLGARYVLQGSIRQGGSGIRVSAQLVDTQTGAQLWAETYNRDLQASTIFEAQDDVAARIVATVADSYGVLVHSMRAAIRQKDDADLTPVEWQFQYFAYREQITPANYATLKSRLESAVKRDDRQSDLWACLAQIYVDEYAFGFGGDATSLDRALTAARRGVELDRANQFAMVALAQTHFFRQDLAAFGPAAERAMALNPLNTDAVGILGLQIVHTGEFERGTAIVRRAMELNAKHAGWMHFAPLWEHFHNGEYEQALECANRVDVPGLFWPYLVMASACGHLGRQSEAKAAVRDLLALDPEFAAHAHSNVGTWHFASGLMDSILEGLRKAGLSIPKNADSSDSAKPNRAIMGKTARAKSGRGAGAVRADEGFWVAVLPFKYSGNNANLTALAEGLTEETVTGLSRFSYLKVIARSSTSRYANESADVRSAGKELGARYVMEGSLRQAGTKLRFAVQLVDAKTGAHLWAENYERGLSPETIFELQDDLVPRIVSTVADMHGVLPRSMSEVVRQKSADQMSPYEALLRSFGYNERFTPEDLAEVRSCLERAIQQAPNNAECWAMLSLMYANEYGHWDNATPDSLDRSLRAARKAVEAAPLHSLPYYALAQALYFKKEFTAFRVAADRAISLNPMDGATAAFMGMLIAYSGDWERGCALSDKGCQLNPNHPGWYCYPAWHDSYRKKDYRKALDLAFQLNAPQNYYTHAVLAMCYAQLGRVEEARTALRDMLALKPNYAEVARELHGRWIQSDLVEQLMDGLRKAGLEIGDKAEASVSAKASDTGELRTNEVFWVAVLPIKYSGSNSDLAALAEGLTEEIVTGLSRFSYLKVIARSSTSRYANESVDVRSAGKELGARYVMEGSLRQAGTKLRVAVQLVDAKTGAHLWAENYERSLSPENLFELQDELVPRIVSTVADQYGALVHSMSESLRGRSAGQYSAHEAMLRAFGYWERMTPEEHAEVRDILEAAVAVAPDHSDCLAELAMIYWHEYAFGYNVRPDSIGRARAAAQRAVAAAPTSHFAHCALATSLFFQKDLPAFRTAADRTLALNRMDSSTAAILGNMIAYVGEWEEGLDILERAMQLNPHHAGWYHYVAFCDAYRKRDYRGALASALKVNMPAYRWPHVYLAAVYGQLGEQQRASAALRELHALVPNFGAIAREEFGKWLDAELTEHLIDGLRKAGLEIDDKAPASPAMKASDAETARANEGFWVAVLPFKYGGNNADLAALAEGLTEEIVTGLSRFSYLKVISRSSTSRYANESVDVRSAGKELGARYVMEGSLRHAGSKLRLAVQLVDAISGAHLWAENYERSFSPDAVFELQDELVPRIVSTVADHYGVLAHSMSESLRSKAPEQLSPYEAVLRSFGYYERLTPDEHATVRVGLERAVQQLPGYADAWAMLSIIYTEEYKYGFNARPDPIERALEAARRATDAAPSNHFAYLALAATLFFLKEFEAFRSAAERAVTLNPMDSGTIAYMGSLISLAGDWERGCALVDRAIQLNPKHPGWYWFPAFYNAYRKSDYRGALNIAVKINMPRFYATHLVTTAAYGQLGERDAASKALRELLVLWPDFGVSAREELGKWFDPELAGQLMDGLRKAGLEIGDKAGASPAVKASDSGAVRADEGFWVAVLPFKYGGNNSLTALAEGIAEEIVIGLSRFSYLEVISRSSTSRYANESVDVRSAGKELGARYVMEGSLRHAGSKLRLAVQLVDAISGAHLWAENYERSFSPDAVFELQDELVPRIVSTVADMNGILPRSMSETVRSRAAEQLSPYEAVLRSFGYFERVTAEELTAARSGLESAVQKAPAYADAWAMLALLCVQDHAQGFNLQADPLTSGATAARHAVEAAPSNHLAFFSLAQALFFQKEFQSFRNAAERAVALNPMDGNSIAFLGELLTYAGDWERGMALAALAKQLNPHHPGWYWYADFYNAYRQGDYRGAINFVLKANLPGHWGTQAALAAAHGQIGEQHAAGKALRDLLQLRPDFAETVRSDVEKWWDPDYGKQFMDGLRKAGLKIAGGKTPASASPK
jgi:TolB-like protein/Tfp pilus assembly protein PilF